MASGTTDEQGNFTISVTNTSRKGVLGLGAVTAIQTNESVGLPVTPIVPDTPVEIIGKNTDMGALITQKMNEAGMAAGKGIKYAQESSFSEAAAQTSAGQDMLKAQSDLNPDVGITQNEDGAFVVSRSGTNQQAAGQQRLASANSLKDMQLLLDDLVALHGPNAAPEPQNIPLAHNQQIVTTHTGTLTRVFRIVPHSKYYYPSRGDIVVQPFESIELTEVQSAYVQEMQITVNVSQQDIIMVAFRDILNKEAEMPFGEGDGKYLFKPLPNPQYDNTAKAFTGTIFDEDKYYEHIWDVRTAAKKGDLFSLTFPALLQHTTYYIEACSKNELGATTFYDASFFTVSGSWSEDPDRWYSGGPCPALNDKNLVLTKLSSRLLVRTLDEITSQAMPGVKVFASNAKILNTTLPGGAFKSTDKDGYVEMLADDPTAPLYHIPKNSSGVINGYLRAYDLPGYHPSPADSGFSIDGAKGIQHYTMLPLKPAGKITIQVRDADNILTTVPAYIRIDSAGVKETNSFGKIVDLPIPSKNTTKITVIPKDLAYFEETFYLSDAQIVSSGSYMKTVNVSRKKHRIILRITDDKHALLSGFTASLSLGDNTLTSTQSAGQPCSFEFENVATAFAIVVRGPTGSNYIPMVVNVVNHESKNPVTYSVQPATGSMISGTVSLDGQPVRHAKVYIDLSLQVAGSGNPWFQYAQMVSGVDYATTKQDESLIVAHTNQQGKFTLYGIPVDVNATLDVVATATSLSSARTSSTVVGDRVSVTIPNSKTVEDLQLNLTTYNDMRIDNLYGLPLTVEELEQIDDNSVKVTGLVRWKEAVSDFDIQGSTQQLRVENVLYVPASGNGPKVGIASEDVTLLPSVTGIKLGYLNGKYNVLLQPKGSPTLKIERNADGFGSISGTMRIVENSFNYTESYLSFNNLDNNFYLATKDAGGNLNNTIHTVVGAVNQNEWVSGVATESAGGPEWSLRYENFILQAMANRSNPRYFLSNASGGPIKFKLLEFNADANPLQSYIHQDGTIRLNVDLTCHIPHAQPEDFTVNIKELVLNDHEVKPAHGDTLSINLGSWKLKAGNWTISPKEGGIVSENVKIQTDIIDIPLEKMVLRAKLFHMEAAEEITAGLTMGGGVANVTLNNKAGQKGKAILQWDNKCGNDMRGHWRFSIMGQNGKPAASTKLRGLFNPADPNVNTRENIDISYLQILDNNEMSFQASSGSRFIFNNSKADLLVQSVSNGPNYIIVSGGLDIRAPRVPRMPLQLTYTGSASNQKIEYSNVKTDFITKGFVHFLADTKKTENIVITAERVVIDGVLYEEPATFNQIPVQLIGYHSGSTSHEIKIRQPGWTMQLSMDTDKNKTLGDTPTPTTSNSGFSLNNVWASTKVVGNDWSLLTFGGTMHDNADGGGFKEDPDMTFTVKGAVEANCDNLQIAQMNTPFGELKTVFDYKNKALIGSVTKKPGTPQIPLPPGINLIEGAVEFCTDPTGFYVAGGLKTLVTIPFVQGHYNLGFMLGSYKNSSRLRSDVWPLVMRYKDPAVKNECYPTFIKWDLAGFFFTLDRVLIDVKKSYNFVVVAGGVKAYAAIGADLFANFSGSATAGLSANLLLKAEGYLRSYTGTSIEGRIGLDGSFRCYYSDNLHLNLSLDMSLGIAIRQWAVLGTVTLFNETVHAQLNGGTHGFSFNFGSGEGPAKPCPFNNTNCSCQKK